MQLNIKVKTFFAYISLCCLGNIVICTILLSEFEYIYIFSGGTTPRDIAANIVAHLAPNTLVKSAAAQVGILSRDSVLH